jgi:autotransporter-associated beta strand protein
VVKRIGGNTSMGMSGLTLRLRVNQVVGANSLFITGPGNLTISGVVSGTSATNPTFGTITKDGPGVLTLTAANTYSGITRVREGKLVINNTTGSATGTGQLIISGGGFAAGASWGGNGITTSAVILAGTVAPGNSIGKLTSGDEEWQGGANYEFEIDNATGTAGVNWDKIQMSSLSITATNAAKFVVKLIGLPGAGTPALDNFDPDQPYEWVIANSSNNTVTGFSTDAFQVDVSQFDNNNTDKGGFYVRYNNTNGDLLLVYVPEPSSAALALLGASSLLRRRSARR